MTLDRRTPVTFALLLVLAACGPRDQAANAAAEDDEEDNPPVPVETAAPTRGDIFAVYTGTAAIEAFAEADVLAKVAGEVIEIRAEEGDDVNKGDVLARLDGDRLRLTLRETEARLRKLERDYERNLDLSKRGLISEGDFENIKFEMEALKASFNLASLELDYTQIRAPIDGVVSERYIKLGSTLSVNDPVFRVTSLDPLVAYMFVPEREFRNIAEGQAVGIDIDAVDGAPLFADVTRVSPIVDPATGTFKVTIEIHDDQRRIKPGMFARIGIIYDTHANALQVPRSAIVEGLEEPGVFVVEDGIAVRRTVRTGFANRGMIEVVEGLDDDDQVVVVGQVGLKADARVNVISDPDEHEKAEASAAEGVSPSEEADDAATD